MRQRETIKERNMQHIWAPWRIKYIQQEKPEGCILCEKPADSNDAANYILYRGIKSFVMLNSYPYNPGHLLVAPFRHIASPEELTAEERSEYFEIVCLAVKVVKQVLSPGGLNIGANLGRIAGAGIEDHFHTHIVPRWQGDTNFMPVLSDIRVMPEALAETYDKLKEGFGHC